ncbi:putative diguanylate cyclase YeaJ [Moorella thermoacetica]|uniref:Diguanylate cyclase (GGDEF domain) n=2 Tax=Neomoorella thermoacetica TaxID=1525 RepID=Q2RGK1_MOOTA|nr:putative diguanylate cyclase YeaJ [Moorella thermoacetica]AKX97617.1 putative diguanylate cyclase YeaJ [Moorella thermoacetica]OIQ10456.1 putative diguanylate cyclase YeaJ [Moorella thermoacetica]OIQ52806.1 putative diguanylate cyclase YeaJ [Moorella thermoacetica]OIQ53160.1 putative diguanylate cyclase YeaJ [Moorella thermoacetica]
MSVEQAKALSEFCKTVIYFLSAIGMGICLHKGRNRKGRGPEKLLLLGLLTMGTGTFLSAYWVKLGLPESWGRILGDLVLVNAGTAVTILAMYFLTLKFHLVALALKKEAVTDPLTGLYNRRTFFRELDCRLERGGSFAVAVLDLDNMKQINDTLGHQIGDEVLRAAARALKKATREKDIAARYGGDEFVVLFAGKGPRVEKFKARLKENLMAELPYTGEIEVGLSTGVAYCPEDGEDARSLLSAADARMYAEKEAKKNRYYAFGLLAENSKP